MFNLYAFPLYDAMDNPQVKEWLAQVPWLKSAFVEGKIQGVLLSKLSAIHVSDRVSESEILELKTKLGIRVEVCE
jgi:hypothetical protein